MFLSLKKNNPIIYQYQHSFVLALKKMVNDDSLDISVSLINFEDTRADVIINTIVVGAIHSSRDNDNSEKNTILKFNPYPDLFKFVQLARFNDFLALSNTFITAFMKTIVIDDIKNPLIQIDNFDNSILFQRHHYSGVFMEKIVPLDIYFTISFSLVKDENDFKLVDNFCIKIEPSLSSTLLLAIANLSLPFATALVFSLEKKNSTFCIKHDHDIPIHSIVFDNNKDTPNMTDFIANIVYYISMKHREMEMPTFKDFSENTKAYKQIFDMSLI